MAAHPQARRGRGRRLGRRGASRERQDGPDERRGQGGPRRRSGSARRPRPQAEIDLAGPSSRRMPPAFIEPMLATLADRAFSDPDWLFEIKWDGYRDPGGRRPTARSGLWTRNGKDGETYFPGLLAAAGRGSTPSRRSSTARSSRSTRTAGPTSRSSRTHLADHRGTGPERGPAADPRAVGRGGRRRPPPAPLVYQVFDLLYLDGRSLLKVPLEDRKRLLRSVAEGRSRACASRPTSSATAWPSTRPPRRSGLEGIVAKQRRCRYEPGRRTPRLAEDQGPAGAGARRRRLDAGGGQRQGARRARRRRVRGRPPPVRRKGRVGVHMPGRGACSASGSTRWQSDDVAVRPAAGPRPTCAASAGSSRELVIRAELAAGRRDGLVRQAAFKGIDDGRDPMTVTRESPVGSAVAGAEVAASSRPPARRVAAGPAAGCRTTPPRRRAAARSPTAAAGRRRPRPPGRPSPRRSRDPGPARPERAP